MRFALPVALLTAFLARPLYAQDVNVSNAGEFRTAFGNATAGQRIVLAPGTYRLDNSLWTQNGGTEVAPIVVTGGSVQDVKIEINAVEGLVFDHPYWTLENVWVDGVCNPPENCQAGIRVRRTADGFTMQDARVTNFSQVVKSSRESDAAADDCSILRTEFYNDVEIDGSVLDLVGGDRWHIADNFIHDFGGDMFNGDYAIFLKGATRDGIVERNLVICGLLRPSFGIEIGISAGGGLTGSQFCPNNDCSCEDFDSIFRNNIVLNCGDVGMHANRACGSRFVNNVVAMAGGGFQVQRNGAGQPVQVRNNVFGGGIFGGDNRVESDNLTDAEAMLATIYADPFAGDFTQGNDTSAVRDRASTINEVTEDYCGTPRPAGASDLGPVEFPAGCATFPWRAMGPPPVGDGGVMPGRDAGFPPGRDAGFRDAGPGRDAGPPVPGRDAGFRDAGPGRDGGAVVIDDPKPDDRRSTSGGCGCRTERSTTSTPWALLVLLVPFVSRARRRAGRSTRSRAS